MRDILLFLFLIVLPAVLTSSSNGREKKDSPAHELESRAFGLTGRIVNGTKAISRQFPYQVSLRRSYSSSHFCGGSLIKEYLVLTAAHCMFRNKVLIQPWTISVVAGELQLDRTTATGQTRGIDQIILHPQFNLYTLQNDVALLVLKVPFELSPEVTNALLPVSPLKSGVTCQVAGWGYPAEDIKKVSNDLMYVDLPILPVPVCRAFLVNVTNLPPGMYCAGYAEGQRDACQGDSGGGMLCHGILTGVVSGGEGCAAPRLPGVYADVFYYRSWINKYTSTPYMELRLHDAADTTKSSVLTLLSAICVILLSRS